MVIKDLNFSGRELPSYLGYGILDENSVRIDEDVIFADYLYDLDGSVVHKVNWEKGRCELETFLHDKFCGVSFYPDLQKVLIYDFLVRDFNSDSCFHFLAKETSSLGNIYVQYPPPKNKRKHINIFYPAGLLMSFLLPVVEWGDKFYLFTARSTSQESFHISYLRERKAFLLSTDPAFKISVQTISLAEFIVPLAYMTRAAEFFALFPIIELEKQYRLMIMESSQTDTATLLSYIGNEEMPFFAYCLVDNNEVKPPQLMNLISNAIENLMQRLNNSDR